jgi:hypothetical protein
MIFEIVNTILLLCSLAINIKILNIANKMRPPKISLADIATDMMSCDNCDAHDACNNGEVRKSSNRNDENNVSPQDNENDNINLLGNNRRDQSNLGGEQREWVDIKINK